MVWNCGKALDDINIEVIIVTKPKRCLALDQRQVTLLLHVFKSDIYLKKQKIGNFFIIFVLFYRFIG